MYDDNQTFVPDSFIALYRDTRNRLTASRETVAARYELCEDLANLLTETAANRKWELGVTEADVLERVHRGLLTDDVGVDTAEARWVIRRLAELLGWPDPEFPELQNI